MPDLVPESDVDLLPRDAIVIVCTGTQGEPRAAIARIAAASHESISLGAGDTVIYSSRQIPGNENAIARVQDMLVRRKINLVTDQDAPVHVSGHPSRDEMIEMYGLVRPKNCNSCAWDCASSSGACCGLLRAVRSSKQFCLIMVR